MAKKRLTGRQLTAWMFPGGEEVSIDAWETVLDNREHGCRIRVRKAMHFNHRPVVVNCSDGYSDGFMFVPAAVEAVREHFGGAPPSWRR